MHAFVNVTVQGGGYCIDSVVRHGRVIATYIIPADTSLVLSAALSVRSWKFLDINAFRYELSASRLCQPGVWLDDTDDLAGMYNLAIKEVLDRLILSYSVVHQPLAADPGFDSEC